MLKWTWTFRRMKHGADTVCHQLRQLPLLLLLVATASLALTQLKFQSMFKLHPPRTSTPSACFGYSPNSVPLMPYVLAAVGDAIDIAGNVQSGMGRTASPTPSGKRMRGLLYISLSDWLEPSMHTSFSPCTHPFLHAYSRRANA